MSDLDVKVTYLEKMLLKFFKAIFRPITLFCENATRASLLSSCAWWVDHFIGGADCLAFPWFVTCVLIIIGRLCFFIFVLCSSFMAHSTQWGHVERRQFT